MTDKAYDPAFDSNGMSTLAYMALHLMCATRACADRRPLSLKDEADDAVDSALFLLAALEEEREA